MSAAHPNPSAHSILHEKALRIFATEFSSPPQNPQNPQNPVWTVRSPGRINLIGEHVDYNDGPVLPLAIEPELLLLAAPNEGDLIRVASTEFHDVVEIPLRGPLIPGPPSWSNYVRGVIAGFERRGVAIPGLNILLISDLPQGSGLSSSAALEVGMATLLENVCRVSITPAEKALLCQRAEHEFAGVPCGIMDQFAIVFGEADHLLLLDCRSLEVTPILVPSEEVEFLIIDTRVKHRLAESAYADRRRTCEEAAATLGVNSLREWPMERLEEARASLGEVAFRRVRHVVSEMHRTFEAVARIRARLVAARHVDVCQPWLVAR